MLPEYTTASMTHITHGEIIWPPAAGAPVKKTGQADKPIGNRKTDFSMVIFKDCRMGDLIADCSGLDDTTQLRKLDATKKGARSEAPFNHGCDKSE